MRKNIALAILIRYPDLNPLEDFTVRDDGEGQYLDHWNNSYSKPSEAELDEWWSHYLFAYQNNSYREKRFAEYPPIEEQLDAIWKILNLPKNSEAWFMKVRMNEIKEKHENPLRMKK
ncbi:XkdW family protein [Heliorestis convoluta]|uniref:Putative xkdW family protein n=1 Tax=Heliorestis convoluta TaxID=356322 RepID=A0A5Q2N1G2_9FIRM|nr:XkdW family protein [Heliorestis convoluta]QGG47659.1 putative xkdW family protein [Heliorestis convoluta]